MLARLAFKLLSLLGLGWKWNVQLWRLLLYAFLLLPGFIQAGFFTMPDLGFKEVTAIFKFAKKGGCIW